ncbi:response regulator [Anabaena cylindrica FACHB-243]|uniref:Response regulator receiver protein n=1 Tax=Anabaena cylindrica (strain ATCC 27899 / PCC 7122) TaxID=272123 RepID=K9ZIQ1_ANACC|nr:MULTISPECIES: response regulator [Anabaena]AFZ59081.1 response regulator receiver protein [Anabaena cylindrica PCC 7122]MBD2420580.1 response regulator [Anabaena cylindrica FACHB-243]MBY5284445.1 response regulator [Anabaena sp. CCAP 1446/1C]MBY5308990.1 response regulator [Anabaena sp. CCAP 1446/1C]MCM2408538.1 response regulator [Anabaena sp. CCAP 1446/1C]
MTTKNTLLIIEDNPDDIELTLLAFERTGLQENVVIARDGVEAINYLFAENTLPDLILLDLQLPRIDGLEVLRQIRANSRTRLLPIVILTTSNEESDRLQGYGLGCNSYIRKPVDYDQFVSVMQQLGMYWLVLNSPSPLTQ